MAQHTANLQPNSQGKKLIEKLLLRKRDALRAKESEVNSAPVKLHMLAKALQISKTGDPRDGVTGDPSSSAVYWKVYTRFDTFVSSSEIVLSHSTDDYTRVSKLVWTLYNSTRQETTDLDRVLYARQNRSLKPQVFGGTPITEDIAISLRTIVFGTSLTSPRSEWLKTGIILKEADSEESFCLESTRNTTRGLLTVVQAEIIKRLIFKDVKVKGEPAEKLLRMNASEQVQVIVDVLSHILWRIGEKTKAVICLPQHVAYFTHSANYFQDGITEKLQTFEITDYEELQIVVKRYLYLFADDSNGGALLFLYSAIMTRGIDKVLKDMEGRKCQLVWKEEEGSMCIVTLLLTGRPTPYLHNGVIYVGDEDHYAVAQFGILSRSEIGLLVFRGGDQVEDESAIPGSRLKTPSFPVWVTYTVGRYAIVFNTNRELLHNYHAEKRFELVLICCGGERARLTVDTRQDEAESARRHSENMATFMDIEKLVHTKWPDAHITWNESTL